MKNGAIQSRRFFIVFHRHRPGSCYGLVVPTAPDTGMVWKSTLSMMESVGVNLTYRRSLTTRLFLVLRGFWGA